MQNNEIQNEISRQKWYSAGQDSSGRSVKPSKNVMQNFMISTQKFMKKNPKKIPAPISFFGGGGGGFKMNKSRQHKRGMCMNTIFSCLLDTKRKKKI